MDWNRLGPGGRPTGPEARDAVRLERPLYASGGPAPIGDGAPIDTRHRTEFMVVSRMASPWDNPADSLLVSSLSLFTLQLCVAFYLLSTNYAIWIQILFLLYFIWLFFDSRENMAMYAAGAAPFGINRGC
jgi:hypothetical protein